MWLSEVVSWSLIGSHRRGLSLGLTRLGVGSHKAGTKALAAGSGLSKRGFASTLTQVAVGGTQVLAGCWPETTLAIGTFPYGSS